MHTGIPTAGSACLQRRHPTLNRTSATLYHFLLQHWTRNNLLHNSLKLYLRAQEELHACASAASTACSNVCSRRAARCRASSTLRALLISATSVSTHSAALRRCPLAGAHGSVAGLWPLARGVPV